MTDPKTPAKEPAERDEVAELVSPADIVAATGTPLVMVDAYIEIGAANLSCFGLEVSIEPELKMIDVETFCGITSFPGPVKWHLKVKFAQTFDTGAVDATLRAAVTAYKSAGTLAPFRVRPHSGKAVGANNPFMTGNAIPTDYAWFGGAAGATSETDIDWILAAPPTLVTT
jgi:hypothetical protein